MLISGSGKSGTTILSLLLSQHDDVFNLAQSRDFWRGFAKDVPCTCSKMMSECDVWGTIARDAFPGWASPDFENAGNLMTAFIRAATNTPHWNDEDTLNKLRLNHSEFIGFLQQFIDACQKVTGRSTFVDTSKSPEIALAYSLLSNVDAFVVNLTRDPRAVITSWAKKMQGNRKTAVNYSRVWLFRERILTEWGRSRPNYYRKISYEALARRPAPYVAQLLNWIEADSDTAFFVGPNRVKLSWQQQHLFPPANEKVLSERAIDVKITPAKQWRALSNWRWHWIALRYTFPDGLTYILTTLLRKWR